VYRSTIGRSRHQPVKDIEFTDEMPFSDTTNRWVA
jgi:hypothetical protein